MTRPEASEQLSAYLDGELTDAEASSLEAELERDPTLRAELVELEGVVQFLREEGPSAPSMGFHAKVMAAVEAEAPEPGSWWAWLRRPFGIPIEGLAVAAAAAAVLLLALPRGDDPGRTEWGTTPEGTEAGPAAFKAPKVEVPQEKGGEDAAPPEDAGLVKEAAKPPPVEKKGTATGKGEKGPSLGTKAAPAPSPTAPVAKEDAAPVTTGTAGEKPRMVSAPNSYDVTTSDPALKRKLLSLIGQLGGSLRSGSDKGVMTTSQEELVIQLPQEVLTDFDRELGKLGVQVDPHLDQQTLYAAGAPIEVQIRLTLEGGATTPLQDPLDSKRTRKKAPGLDEPAPADETMFEAEELSE